MRIRDKIFPEGTKARKMLRAICHVIKGFKPHNIKTVIKLIKEHGLVKTIKEIKGIVFGNVHFEDLNKTYQEWIKHNEPTPEQIEEQRKTTKNKYISSYV